MKKSKSSTFSNRPMRGCRSRNCAAGAASATLRSTSGVRSRRHGRVRRQAAEGTGERERQAQEAARRSAYGHACAEERLWGKAYGIGGQYAKRLLDRAALFRGHPGAVRTDNRPEFTSRVFMAWAQTHGIRHILIQPGHPMQNSNIESFNGKFRYECLNEHWFDTLPQARNTIAVWRQDYNEVQPHSSCRRIPPAKFAALHRQRATDAVQFYPTTKDSFNLATGLPAKRLIWLKGAGHSFYARSRSKVGRKSAAVLAKK